MTMIKERIYPVPAVAAQADDTDGLRFAQDMVIDVLARTLWGEARGEGREGMQAVACVILNRVAIARAKGGYWWGNDIVGVCHKPFQFSCWNKDDPNYPQLLRASESDRLFAAAKEIATLAVAGQLPDITNGADHYHALSVSPYWARGQSALCVIGHHAFYKLVSA